MQKDEKDLTPLSKQLITETQDLNIKLFNAEVFAQTLQSDLQKAQERVRELEQSLSDITEESTAYKVERDQLKLDLAEAKKVISNFQKKTEVYLKLYLDDKELQKYKDQAREYQQKRGT